MRGSLLVLDELFLFPLDAAVGELGSEDLVAAVRKLAGASPVPVQAADELEASDLLVSKVCDNLQHFSTVAVEAEDLQVEQTRTVDSVLQDEGAGCKAANQPLGILNVVPKMSLHLN